MAYHSTGLAGVHQVNNASIATHLAREFFQKLPSVSLPPDDLPSSFQKGLQNARWPGRCQTVADPAHEGTTWFLDGAHTLESLEWCMRWYASQDTGLRDTAGKKYFRGAIRYVLI